MKAGYNMLLYSGFSDKAELEPYLSAELIKPKFHLILGNYSINNIERVDQLFFYENNIVRPFKEGLFMQVKRRLPLTIFVDWQNFIVPNDSLQEVFHAGLLSSAHLIKFQSSSFIYDISLDIFHKGGQINADPKPPLTIIYNYTASISYQLKSQKINHAFSSYLLGFSDLSKEPEQNSKNGNAMLFEYTCFFGKNLISLSQWISNAYYSPFGNELFFSEGKNDQFNRNRQVLSLKFTHKNVYEHWASTNFNTTAHYDIEENRIDYSISLIFDLKTKFKIHQFN